MTGRQSQPGGELPAAAELMAIAHLGRHQDGLAVLINAMQRKHGLGEIDSNEQNGHGLLLPNETKMSYSHFPSWSFMTGAAHQRLVRDGEVPFIR